jgi:hypothetical protein
MVTATPRFTLICGDDLHRAGCKVICSESHRQGLTDPIPGALMQISVGPALGWAS